ncbi:hypothetical protein D3C83_178680 [compost metagenome]
MFTSNNDEHQSYSIKVRKAPEGEDGFVASSMGLEARGRSEASATTALKQELYNATAQNKLSKRRIA